VLPDEGPALERLAVKQAAKPDSFEVVTPAVSRQVAAATSGQVFKAVRLNEEDFAERFFVFIQSAGFRERDFDIRAGLSSWLLHVAWRRLKKPARREIYFNRKTIRALVRS
jgi:hypothetical protein